MVQPRAVGLSLSRSLLRSLTCAVFATLIFPITYTIDGISVAGYSPWRQTISSLSHAPHGWVQNANFMVLGLIELWVAHLWRQVLRGGPGGRWYPVLRAIEGLGLIGLGIFSWDPEHTTAMIVTIVAMDIALFVIAWRLRQEPAWRGWALFSLICALWPNVVMPLFGMALGPQSGLGPYAGLLERLATNADTIWALVLLIPLWRGVAPAGPPATAAA